MRIAVQGCSHGELDKIYESIIQSEKETGQKVDLLICCGDFQACRNEYDMKSMKIPKKHARIASFWQYYCGEILAPCLTIVIGGNHEASNYMWELYYGGWLAPRIYYLGSAGVVNVGGLRIGGLSGIYKKFDYHKGHHEVPPLSAPEIVSIFHVRSLEVMRCKSIKKPVDVFLSHDWPLGVYDYGDKEQLIRCKPFFQEDISINELGSPPAAEILEAIQPCYWFSGHLHVKFSAIIPHDEFGKSTRFLALDKCLPRRRFLQILDIGAKLVAPPILEYDPEWLAILVKTAGYYNPLNFDQKLPPCVEVDEDFIASVAQKFGSMIIPENFSITVPCHGQDAAKDRYLPTPNPQSAIFCAKLGVKNETVPDGFKDIDSIVELDITHDSDTNMTFNNSSLNTSNVNCTSPPAESAIVNDVVEGNLMFKDFSAPELKTPNATKKRTSINPSKSSTPVTLKRRLTLPAPKNSTETTPTESTQISPIKVNPVLKVVAAEKELKSEQVIADEEMDNVKTNVPTIDSVETETVNSSKNTTGGIEEDFDLDETDDDLISKFLSLKKKFGRNEALSDSMLVNTSVRELVENETKGEVKEESSKKFKMEIHNELDR